MAPEWRGGIVTPYLASAAFASASATRVGLAMSAEIRSGSGGVPRWPVNAAAAMAVSASSRPCNGINRRLRSVRRFLPASPRQGGDDGKRCLGAFACGGRGRDGAIPRAWIAAVGAGVVDDQAAECHVPVKRRGKSRRHPVNVVPDKSVVISGLAVLPSDPGPRVTRYAAPSESGGNSMPQASALSAIRLASPPGAGHRHDPRRGQGTGKMQELQRLQQGGRLST